MSAKKLIQRPTHQGWKNCNHTRSAGRRFALKRAFPRQSHDDLRQAGEGTAGGHNPLLRAMDGHVWEEHFMRQPCRTARRIALRFFRCDGLTTPGFFQ
jgi:hypothetical protein